MNRFERLERMVGTENILNLKSKKVVVIGIGGVGGYVVETLVRSGIEHITLVDYDVVDVTNMNRQIIATEDNIGKLKVLAYQERINKINPDCKIQFISLKIDPTNIDLLFKDNPDYIVDACDSLDVKKMLIVRCFEKKVKLISSMGTGNKMDPSKLKIMDIRKTAYDPIARKLRQFVNSERIKYKIPVVCSTERPLKISSPVGSNAFVPAMAGILCASYVINDIVGDVHDFN